MCAKTRVPSFHKKSVSGNKCAKNDSPGDTKNFIKTKNKKQKLLEKLSFLAAKKEPPKMFLHVQMHFGLIFRSRLLDFRMSLLSFSVFYGGGGKRSGTSSFPFKNLFDDFFKRGFTCVGTHFPTRLELPCT